MPQSLSAVFVHLIFSEHHRKLTCQEELRLFLHRHQLDWDEQYVWD